MHRISEQKRRNHSIWNTFAAAASSHHVWMCNLTLRSILHKKQLGASEHTRNVPISLALVIIQAVLRPTEKWKVHVLLQLWDFGEFWCCLQKLSFHLDVQSNPCSAFLHWKSFIQAFWKHLNYLQPTSPSLLIWKVLTSPVSIWGRLYCNSLCAEHRKRCLRKRALNHLCVPCVPLA